MKIILAVLTGLFLGAMLFRTSDTDRLDDCSTLIFVKAHKARSDSGYSGDRSNYEAALHSLKQIIAASEPTYGFSNRLLADLTDFGFMLNDVVKDFARVNFLEKIEYAGPAKARIQAGFGENTLYASLENMAGASTCDLARLIPDRDRDSLATAQRKITALKMLLDAP